MRKPAQAKYIAPAVHAFLFLAMWALYAGFNQPMMNGPASLPFTILLIADLPFSFFAFGVMFTSTTYGGIAFALWGIGGTLWSHLLGRVIDALIRRIRGRSAGAQPLIDPFQSDATVAPARRILPRLNRKTWPAGVGRRPAFLKGAMMKGTIRTLLLSYVALSLCVVIGCRSKGPTNLCDGFQSYETAQSIRNKLGKLGVIGNWQENLQSVGPPDRRPPYQLLTLSGPFILSGINGRLKLTLYNDRLMSSEFTTGNGREYLAKLREEHARIPEDSGKGIQIDRRTEFQYFIVSDGTFRFLWTDPQLESEWNEWVRRNA